MRRWLGCLWVLIVGCGSSGNSSTGHDTGTEPSCSASDIVITGRGAMPSVGWMQLGETSPHAVAVDAGGNVFVAGELSSGVDLGGGPLVGNSANAGGADAFLVSYTARGKHRWSKRFGGTGYDRFMGMGVDSAGNVYATGEFTTGSDVGAGTISGNEVLIASFGNDGAFRWASELGVSRAWDLAVQQDGTSYVTGEFGGTAMLGGSALASSGGVDAFLTSFDAHGTHRWSVAVGGNSNDTGFAVATNGSGVVLTGTFYETLTLGGTTVTSTGGSQDVFVASFDDSGAPLWSRSVGGDRADMAGGVAVDADGVVYANGSLRVDATGTDESGFYLSSFDATGADRADLASTGTSFAVGTAVATGAGGNVYVTGRFSGSSDFGGGELQTDATQAVLASYDGKLGHRFSLGLDWVGPPSGPDGVSSGKGAAYVIGNFSLTRKHAGTAVTERPFLVQFVEGCR